MALARRDDVDVFVELIGGDEGPAKAAVLAALAAGKDVVTANKALLAIHGQTLAETAESQGRALRYEAAVAGGIPVIKALTEGLAGKRSDPCHGRHERIMQLHPDADGGCRAQLRKGVR